MEEMLYHISCYLEEAEYDKIGRPEFNPTRMWDYIDESERLFAIYRPEDAIQNAISNKLEEIEAMSMEGCL